MSNPWGNTLRKTGLNEQRLQQEQSGINDLQQRQGELQTVASENASKFGTYDDRQASLAADAMYGQQGRLDKGGKKKSRRHKRKTRKSRKSRKARRRH